MNLVDGASGHIVEAQITVKPLYDVKTQGGGHGAYKIARLLDLNATKTSRFCGVPNAVVFNAIRRGVIRILELHGVNLSKDDLESLFSPVESESNDMRKKGVLVAKTCAIVSLSMHTIEAMHGWKIGDRMAAVFSNIGQFLQVLCISNCGLQGKIFGQIGKLCPHLEELDLSCNPGINGKIPAEVTNLDRLKILDLHGVPMLVTL